ncbi:hypothetical protein [Pelomonas aquatica]|jgi:hypothetical protein|uniref:Uncharacterized protein n=1 Tax=Pelomonas aquatica TaxID=431058 RepID=A0A9X4R3B2_9BURK|nr:hypothetical protein [Pelomonas aquatica]MDG0861897.1 hypothetical protein [Pelomonas aquatica]
MTSIDLIGENTGVHLRQQDRSAGADGVPGSIEHPAILNISLLFQVFIDQNDDLTGTTAPCCRQLFDI